MTKDIFRTGFSVKHLTCALALSGACVGVNAATTNPDLGLVVPGVPTVFSGFTIPSGDFSDIFTFSLPANSGSGYAVANFSIPGLFNTLLSTMTLASNPDGIVLNGDEVLIPGGSTVVPGGASLTMTVGPLPAGPMLLNVTGLTNGSEGGLYSGAITVTAIPEPETWAMMLVGAGLIGFQLRRKSKQMAVQRFA